MIGGSHGLDNDLAYDLKIHVPKDKWKGLETGASGLAKDLTDKIGISNITEDLIFEVNGFISGLLVKPEVKIKGVKPLHGDSGQTVQEVVIDEVNDKVDSIRTVVEDTIAVVENTAREKVDSLKNEVITTVDSTKQAIEAAADSTFASFEDIIVEERTALENESADLLDSIQHGNIDSVMARIKILIDSKGKQLDSLKIPDDIKRRFRLFSKKGE